MAPKRSKSAPKERPSTSKEPSSSPPVLEILEADELEALPAGKGYESCDEDDAPPEVVEDAGLIGMADRAPNGLDEDTVATARTVADSPTRSKEVSTGAEKAKKLTAAQERKVADDAKWTEMKVDGSEQHDFARPSADARVGAGPIVRRDAVSQDDAAAQQAGRQVSCAIRCTTWHRPDSLPIFCPVVLIEPVCALDSVAGATGTFAPCRPPHPTVPQIHVAPRTPNIAVVGLVYDADPPDDVPTTPAELEALAKKE